MNLKNLMVSMAALATLPAWAQTVIVEAPQAATTQGRATAQISPEKLQALRQSMLARIAVYDAAEKAMRRPTEAEQTALSAKAPAAGGQRFVALPGGGMAVRADMADVSFLVAEIQADGKAAVRHTDTAKAASGQGKVQNQSSKQGDSHGH